MSTSPICFSLGKFERPDGMCFLGVVIDDAVAPVSQIVPSFDADVTLSTLLENWDENFSTLKAGVAAHASSSTFLPVDQLKILSPIDRPPQVFCTGANYGRHVVEMVMIVGLGEVTAGKSNEEKSRIGEEYVARQRAEANPYIFLLPPSAVVGQDMPFPVPPIDQKPDFELELGVVIGKQAFRATENNAMSHVAGYVIVNDLTARARIFRTDPGAIGPDWLAAKGGFGFLPVGPYFVPAEFISDPHNLQIRLSLNGKLFQNDNSNDMTFSIARQIEHVSQYARMLPGDLLCTGSPAGNGIVHGVFLKDGDVIEGEIEGLGCQRLTCVSDNKS